MDGTDDSGGIVGHGDSQEVGVRDPILEAHRVFSRTIGENQVRDEQIDPLRAAIAAYLSARAVTEGGEEAGMTGREEYVPIELADRIIAGEHPLRAWREYRGLSINDLAAKSGITAAFLDAIEARELLPARSMLVPIAKALSVDIEDLIPPRGDSHDSL